MFARMIATLATISGTNPLMKLAVAPNLDHGKKVRGEKHTHTHTQSPRELKDLWSPVIRTGGGTGHTAWPGKSLFRVRLADLLRNCGVFSLEFHLLFLKIPCRAVHATW